MGSTTQLDPTHFARIWTARERGVAPDVQGHEGCEDGGVRRAVAPLLAVTVALVLADSAVVTLALPDILRHLHASVGQVAWVLIAFNLVLGLGAVPAAMAFVRARPHVLSAIGIAVFAGASAWCAWAGSIEGLVAARCVQAIGGALALVGCLELLIAEYGERRGVAAWVTAGVVGTATGPVAGGLLTEAFSWQAIFVVQVPVAVVAVPAALAVRAAPPVKTDRHRPAIRANLTLALLSAALTAALFLLVLLLVEGWRRSPATAALTVSVVPLAALAARPLARLLRAPPGVEVAAGCFLIAGGLAGLAHPAVGRPRVDDRASGPGRTRARADRRPAHVPGDGDAAAARPARAGGRSAPATSASCVGLALLTPVFTADLQDAQVPAQEAIAALVLDAPLKPDDKIAVAQALGDELTDQQGRVPDLHDAFASLDLAPEERAAAAQLERDLDAQLQRAATRAFRDSFLIGSGLALLALLTVLVPRGRRRTP